ncbi:MAG TPA: CBS domain-containing protein, partial [bacterium]|nr:CBS domain-containing protein [bacterium]
MNGHLTARDVMTAQVITVRPETAVKEAAALMLAHHVSGLPVVTVEGELVGIVTEADLLYKETGRERAEGRFSRLVPRFGRGTEVSRKAEGLTVVDLMSSPAITVKEETPLHDVAALMVRRRINRVPVMRQGRLAGIVSRADVLRAFTRPDAEMARTVRAGLLRELWVDVSRIQVAVRDG